MPIKRRFTLTIEDAGGSNVPVIVRVRGWLKAGLRGWHLRCVRAVEESPDGQNPASDPDDDQHRGEPAATR
jgi:hypothetical protein